MSRSRRRRRRFVTPRWAKYAIVAVVGVVAVVLAGMALQTRGPAPEALPPPTNPISETPADEVEDVFERLDDADYRWIWTVMGDSTGNEPDEWVYLVAAELSKKHDRPFVVHNWSEVENQYVSETVVGSGAGVPAHVYNGSASGRNGDYSLEHFATMMPEASDLITINHGHNYMTGSYAAQQINVLVSRAGAVSEALDPTVQVVLQNPRTDATATTHGEVVAAIRDAFASRENVETLDAWTAFDSADLSVMLETDGRHPSAAGSELWFSAVAPAFGL